MLDESTMLLLEQLRLATALTHALPQVGLELLPAHGAPLVVSHNAALSPDMSPCAFRSLVGRMESNHDIVLELGWLSDLSAIRLGGHDVMIEDSVVAVRNGTDDRLITAFATTLDSPSTMASARQRARDWIADDPAAVEALRDVQLRVEHDPELRASAVLLPWSADEDPRDALQLTAAIAGRCAVDELLATVLTR